MEAEKFLLSFRSQPNALSVAMGLLEAPNPSPMIKFHSACAIKEIMVVEYSIENKGKIHQIRDHVLDHVLKVFHT